MKSWDGVDAGCRRELGLEDDWEGERMPLISAPKVPGAGAATIEGRSLRVHKSCIACRACIAPARRRGLESALESLGGATRGRPPPLLVVGPLNPDQNSSPTVQKPRLEMCSSRHTQNSTHRSVPVTSLIGMQKSMYDAQNITWTMHKMHNNSALLFQASRINDCNAAFSRHSKSQPCNSVRGPRLKKGRGRRHPRSSGPFPRRFYAFAFAMLPEPDLSQRTALVMAAGIQTQMPCRTNTKKRWSSE